MKNQISFMSGLFDTAKLSPPIANDRHFGKDLAIWMTERSKGGEFEFGAPTKTEGGWSEIVTANGESFVLGFGIVDGSAGSDYANWIITIDNPKKWSFFASKPSETRSRLCDHIQNILRDEGQIRELQWS